MPPGDACREKALTDRLYQKTDRKGYINFGILYAISARMGRKPPFCGARRGMQGKMRRAGAGGEGSPGPHMGYWFACRSCGGLPRTDEVPGRNCDTGTCRATHGKNGGGPKLPHARHNYILTANARNDNKQSGVFACDIGTHLQKCMVKWKKLLQIPLVDTIMRGDKRNGVLLA